MRNKSTTGFEVRLGRIGDERLVPFSARSPQALRAYAQSLADALERRDDVSLDDVVYSAGERRSHHEHRAALVVHLRTTSPGDRCAVTAALTQPVDAARLPRHDGPVEFRERAEVVRCD